MPRSSLTSVLAGLALCACVLAGAALAGGDQRTNPDACAVLKPSRVKSVLGPAAISHRQPFALPELPEADRNINHFLDVSRTGCTWVDPRRGTAVNVQVYERNADFTGKKPWTPATQRNILALLGSKGYYALVDNDKQARKRAAPWLAGEDVMLVWDRATRGRLKAIVATDPTDELWIAISVVGGGRSAIDVATAVTKHLLGG
ncbi:MAG: hypothetical protein ACKVUT_17995 [Gaiella sp.]